MTYRELAKRLGEKVCFTSMGEADIAYSDVVDILVDYFRSVDPEFDEGGFVGATNGA